MDKPDAEGEVWKGSVASVPTRAPLSQHLYVSTRPEAPVTCLILKSIQV